MNQRLNGQYVMYYRKTTGGKGYVFQGRFNSTLIEKDAYLLHSIVYLLRNPVRAGIVRNADDYIWSSIKSYYSDSGIRDCPPFAPQITENSHTFCYTNGQRSYLTHSPDSIESEDFSLKIAAK